MVEAPPANPTDEAGQGAHGADSTDRERLPTPEVGTQTRRPETLWHPFVTMAA